MSGGSPSPPHPTDPRDAWPRDFGRDGVSGWVSADRAMRARDVSRPSSADESAAEQVVDELLARVEGRRPARSPRPGDRHPRGSERPS